MPITTAHPAWVDLKAAASALHLFAAKDGSIPDPAHHAAAREHVDVIAASILRCESLFPWDAEYLRAAAADFGRWADEGFGVPDFLDSLTAFQPQKHRIDGLQHLVVFPMYTQNGSTNRLVEAVLVEVVWPAFVAELEAGDYSNKLFVPIRFIDFTDGYDTNAAVLFPETIAMRAIPTFTWGAIFADREAARFRRVVKAAAETTGLELPPDAARLLGDQKLAEETFAMWDLIHDRTHMRGDLPFDPFMIKQRMPYFLYSLEELRCDLTAFRESVKIVRAATVSADDAGGQPERDSDDVGSLREPQGASTRSLRGPFETDAAHPPQAKPQGTEARSLRRPEAVSKGTYSAEIVEHAKLVQFAVIFDRIFRFALTGSRVRNYDGLGGQLLFAWLHQHHVLHWTDTKLSIDWDQVPDVVLALGNEIEELYWRSIDRPKTAHWLAAYDLVAGTLDPHPASNWAVRNLPLTGPPKALTDAVLDDEFPLSMFYEALAKKMAGVIESTAGITAENVDAV